MLQNVPAIVYFLLALDNRMNTQEDYLKLSTFTRFAVFELYLFLQLFIITYHPMLRRDAVASLKARLFGPCYGTSRGNKVACGVKGSEVGRGTRLELLLIIIISDLPPPKTIDGKDLLDRVTANPIDDHFKNLTVFWERITPI